MSNDIKEEVRTTYANVALAVAEGSVSCCDSWCCGDGQTLGSDLYEVMQREEMPESALLASLGCGNPTAVADLKEGETVLDLGSGGGIDVLLSAKRVGSTGQAYGLDMTEEMLQLARKNQSEAGIVNAEFLKGDIESIPLPESSVDVVISNCVINLASDKPAVFREMRRVLRPGGRVGVSDIVASDELSSATRAERGSFVGCVAGALSFTEYALGLTAEGFVDVSVEPTHEVVPGMFAATIRARVPE